MLNSEVTTEVWSEATDFVCVKVLDCDSEMLKLKMKEEDEVSGEKTCEWCCVDKNVEESKYKSTDQMWTLCAPWQVTKLQEQQVVIYELQRLAIMLW